MTFYEAVNGRSGPRDPRSFRPAREGAVGFEGDASPASARESENADLATHQAERLLTAVLWTTILSALAIGVSSAVSSDWVSSFSLFGLAGLCAPLFLVGRRWGRRVAGWILSGLILTVVTVNLVDGYGLHDSGILSYPVFLICGGLILGKRSLWILTASCYTSLGLLIGLDLAGRLRPGHFAGPDDLAVFVVLLAATAMMLWVSIDIMEKDVLRVRRSEARVRLAYEQTLEAWGRALEFRDQETEGHSRRVTDLAVRLATACGLEKSEVRRIRWGALLHDIGKLAIPDRILRKPGPLSLEERELMNRHPEYAREMLEGIPFLRSVVEIPYHHHERWDGAGYPEGLEGERIPLAARIFAVVDQWEALSSDRPYRRAWSREEIVEHVKRESGSSFDPAVVSVFLERVEPEI